MIELVVRKWHPERRVTGPGPCAPFVAGRLTLDVQTSKEAVVPSMSAQGASSRCTTAIDVKSPTLLGRSHLSSCGLTLANTAARTLRTPWSRDLGGRCRLASIAETSAVNQVRTLAGVCESSPEGFARSCNDLQRIVDQQKGAAC